MPSTPFLGAADRAPKPKETFLNATPEHRVPDAPPSRRARRTRRARRVASPFVTLDRSRCEACWECIAVCPESVLGKIDVWFHHHAVVSAGDRCLGCRRCVKVCAAGALSVRRDSGGPIPVTAANVSTARSAATDRDPGVPSHRVPEHDVADVEALAGLAIERLPAGPPADQPTQPGLAVSPQELRSSPSIASPHRPVRGSG